MALGLPYHTGVTEKLSQLGETMLNTALLKPWAAENFIAGFSCESQRSQKNAALGSMIY
jgi:hypothetical protein